MNPRSSIADAPGETTLDPDDWAQFAQLMHQAVDEAVHFVQDYRTGPVWRAVPPTVKQRLSQGIPESGMPLQDVYAEFKELVLPFPTGNIHPRHWAWVNGSGTAAGILGDLLASAMNCNVLGIDESSAAYVELAVLRWLKNLLGFPDSVSAALVSGCSLANLVGLAVARGAKLTAVRGEGLFAYDKSRPIVYASTQSHSSIQRAIELLGFGSASLRLIETNDAFEIDTDLLVRQIDQDVAAGLAPAIVIANIGTVNTGAIDPLPRLIEIARTYDLWLHADGAFGAIAKISSASSLGLERLAEVDSLAFDLHKWLYQQYDLACIIVRSAEQHRSTFALTPAYLRSAAEGLTSGPVDFSAFAPRLSRSFSALRAWFSFKHNGFEAHRAMVDKNLRQAAYLTQRIRATDCLELLAPTRMNVVNYRFNPRAELEPHELNSLNEKIVVALQTRGIAAPSTTLLGGNLSIRVAIVNHRSKLADFDELVAATLRIGKELVADTDVAYAREEC